MQKNTSPFIDAIDLLRNPDSSYDVIIDRKRGIILHMDGDTLKATETRDLKRVMKAESWLRRLARKLSNE